MAWRTAGNVGRRGGPLILFFPPCCFKPAINPTVHRYADRSEVMIAVPRRTGFLP
jgi:hypothetical protein